LVENKCSNFPGQSKSGWIESAPGSKPFKNRTVYPTTSKRGVTAYRTAKIPGGHCVPVDFMERIEIRHDGGVLSVLNGQGLRLPEKSASGWIESASGSLINSNHFRNSKRRRIY
jgi:hypothetical protein